MHSERKFDVKLIQKYILLIKQHEVWKNKVFYVLFLCFKNIFFKNINIIYFKLIFLNCFDILILKILYFNIFLNKKYFKKQLLEKLKISHENFAYPYRFEFGCSTITLLPNKSNSPGVNLLYLLVKNVTFRCWAAVKSNVKNEQEMWCF
jgi:hypothetical protein